ncbi:MAG: DUF4249 domain-containing protein [Prolixibacteraceae bacterium]|jgi:hypothetical protein|nr:DUF4249 domain-containing protein [Prolixibacteraceae bacterium]
MKIKLILIINLLLVLSACVDEIKLKEDYTSKKLVVSSFITNGENIVVNLYQNKPINSKYEPALKTKANIVLYENGNKKETLKPIVSYSNSYDYENQTQITDSTYMYTSEHTEIKTGNTYKIVVECEGYETVTAETTVPFPVPVNAFDSLTVHKESHGSKYTEYDYKLSFTDPAQQNNYYRLIVSSSIAQKNTLILGTDTIEFIYTDNYPRSSDFISSDPLLSNENKDANSYLFGELDNSYGIFTDEMLNGKPYEIKFTANFQDYSNDEIDYEAGEFRKVQLVLQSLNVDMFYYLRSIDAQEYSDYMMFTEPVPIYSNVENGFGVFGAYVNSEVELFYGEYPKDGVIYYTNEDIIKLYEEFYTN